MKMKRNGRQFVFPSSCSLLFLAVLLLHLKDGVGVECH